MAYSTYDPKKHGALCDQCPLNGQGYVAPEKDVMTPMGRFTETPITIVGECPSSVEVSQGRMFAGPAGTELDKALRMGGIKRGNCHVTNVVLCNPPGKDLKTFLQKLSKYNRTKAPNEPTIASPIDCCRPRLEAEIEDHRHFITLGKTANHAVTGNPSSIMSVRGALVELEETERTPPRKVMPTVPPGLILHQMKYAHVFRNDIAKAGRWFRGEAKYEPPEIIWHPTADVLREFLFRPKTAYAFDLETDGINNLKTKIRCIGIGNEKEVALVGLLGKDGYTKFYSRDEEAKVIQVLRDYFSDDSIVKVAHNGINFDAVVLYNQLGIRPRNIVDTMLAHKSVESELPHGLGYVVSLYAEAPAWKCYDGETEVLTPNGWVRFDQLEKNVQVAQWDRGNISFVLPRAYVNQPYTGKMWRLDTQAADLLVTPNHKMVYFSKYHNAWKECEVQDFPGYGYVPHTGVKESSVDNLERLGLDLSAFIQLVVAFQADGSWGWKNNEKAEAVCLDFGFTKTRKITRLKDILDRLELPFQETQTGTVNPRTRIWVEKHPIVKVLFDLLGRDKHFGPWLFDLDLETRCLFLDELLLWDGTKGEEHTNYNSSVEHNSNWVQACAVVSGRAARKYAYVNDKSLNYRVSLPSGSVRSRDKSKVERSQFTTIDFQGQIYCVNVPSGFILVRRNGKVTVSGNSDREGQKLSTMAETDEALHRYCCLDVALTEKVAPKLLDSVQLRGQSDVWKLDQRIQEICAEMHMTGMYVDQKLRLETEIKLLKRRQDLLNGIRERLENDKFNPNSVDQLRDLLFTKWKLTPPLEEEERFTSTGDPSTSDLILRALLSEEMPENYRDVIKRIRYYRKVVKVLGTYVTKLRPSNVALEDDLGWDDEDEDWIDRETRKKYGLEKTGIVDPLTGRMYPGYSAGVAVTGRLSSSKPINAQNFPKGMRKIITAAPGNILIGADMDQLELRIAAARWNVELYLRAFLEGKDPHSMTAYAVFGDQFCKAAGIDPAVFASNGRLIGTDFDESGKFKGTGESKKLRDLSKAVQYASQYMAKVETVHKLIQKTEVENKDGTTDLPYARLPLRQVREMHSNWLKGAPEFEQGWEKEINTYRRQGYLAEPITGRRRDFLDGESPNEIVNFNVQSTAAGLMNVSLVRLAEEIPFEKWGPGTGIINQCHDAIVIECPADGCSYSIDENGKKRWDIPKDSIPYKTARLLEECLRAEHPSLPGVVFTASSDIEMSWDKV